jgi:hypothetical protein
MLNLPNFMVITSVMFQPLKEFFSFKALNFSNHSLTVANSSRGAKKVGRNTISLTILLTLLMIFTHFLLILPNFMVVSW